MNRRSHGQPYVFQAIAAKNFYYNLAAQIVAMTLFIAAFRNRCRPAQEARTKRVRWLSRSWRARSL
ncbi:hypothetical protein G8O24_08460 [Bradyrhizobium sp. INPA01-394B]|uniref:Uncharacterized protein n=1 Tax=Bradyrhizobium campsiandrae TaxID=1729892 RepID=A0ABR7TZS0_9BRAD|nr:hypothetical protein [Bradyrhizobium campsiandrae]MBC9877377.1 hypothetical protein [Bradyrhizobium campsiandrae]MBC9976667.1 hypothetical protein [Bradyrhizobium campsiandrae]